MAAPDAIARQQAEHREKVERAWDEMLAGQAEINRKLDLLLAAQPVASGENAQTDGKADSKSTGKQEPKK